MIKEKTICWKSLSGDLTDKLLLTITDFGIYAQGNIIHSKLEFKATYNLYCDANWVTRKVNVEIQNQKEKKMLNLESDGEGTWTRYSQPVPSLTGAIDVDMSATPFTNTLPIRRLKLKEKLTSEIKVVYISIPELEFSLKNQRYTCVEAYSRYLFEQSSENFKQEILVDEEGIVTLYPTLFKRVEC